MKHLHHSAKIRRGNLEAKVSFPNLKINLESKDPVNSLKELNKIIHTLKAIEFNRDYYSMEDDPFYFRLAYLSEELRSHPESMDFIRSAMKVEENLRIKKLAIENTKVIDFQSNEYTSSLDNSKIKPKIYSMLKGMENSSYVFIHIIGGCTANEKEAIIDLIRNKLPSADIRTLFTNKEVLGKTVIEGIFFGPFEEEVYF
ncbi:hypothetical protein HYV79_04250 [Candidatus Woesearchaeota archaeon]|nr:hypothetical protein [Candidatus Woesearchaeota archaeon]